MIIGCITNKRSRKSKLYFPTTAEERSMQAVADNPGCMLVSEKNGEPYKLTRKKHKFAAAGWIRKQCVWFMWTGLLSRSSLREERTDGENYLRYLSYLRHSKTKKKRKLAMNTLWRKLGKFLWPWEGRNYDSVPIRNSVPIGNKTYLFLSYSFSCLEYILSLTVKNYAKSSKYVQSFSTVLWIFLCSENCNALKINLSTIWTTSFQWEKYGT